MSKTLLPDKITINKNADRSWMKLEVDEFLDDWFAGASYDRLAAKYKRNRKAIEVKKEQFQNNVKDKCLGYEPRSRASRIGKRFNENELLFAQAHRNAGVPLKVTAKVMQRKVSELEALGKPGPSKVAQVKAGLSKFVPTLDLIQALRYAFYVYKDQPQPATDAEYDTLVEEEVEYGGGGVKIAHMRASDPKGCPLRIKSLAQYLVELKKDLDHEKPSPRSR